MVQYERKNFHKKRYYNKDEEITDVPRQTIWNQKKKHCVGIENDIIQTDNSQFVVLERDVSTSRQGGSVNETVSDERAAYVSIGNGIGPSSENTTENTGRQAIFPHQERDFEFQSEGSSNNGDEESSSDAEDRESNTNSSHLQDDQSEFSV
ncbi:uncharacterized protein LOC113215536 [Frankliniella occidentalis]|uniref:Uncharacterized protein LOC113215536 n=1 Tax=Frankliniella occidentalis TaxID=133901 RepID=A0A9C6XBA4_FRAOC|nr:uncharacterized protein LOC113215536 [Frankliniella occidentalis]